MKPRISMVTLGVKDVPAAAAFYREGLRLPQRESPPQVAFFTLDGTWLGLFGWADLAKDAGISVISGKEGASGFSGITLSHNVVSEKEVGRVMDQALAAGASLVKEPLRAAWGGFHGYFADPDGHLWEVAHNPYFWVGPPEKR